MYHSEQIEHYKPDVEIVELIGSYVAVLQPNNNLCTLMRSICNL